MKYLYNFPWRLVLRVRCRFSSSSLSAFFGWVAVGWEFALGGGGLLWFLGGAGGGDSRRFRRLFVERQPGTSLLQLHAVSGMTYGVHERIDAGHHFAGTGGNHCGSGRQKGLIPKGANQRHNSVRRPRAKEQEAYGDGRFGYPDFRRLLVFVHIRTQRFHVHLLGLIPQCFLVAKDMAHNLGVVVRDHRGGTHEAEEEDAGHKESRIEVIGEIVKGAGCQISLRHKTAPSLRVAGNHPWSGVHVDEYDHGNGLAMRHLALHGSSDHIESIVGYKRIGGTGSDSRIGANDSKDLASQMTQRISLVEAIVDEYRSLDHHHEVTEGQIDDQYIGGSSQRFGCREDPNHQSIAQHRHQGEEDVERAQQVVHRFGRLRVS